ncbi:hypothetical protein SAMN05216565_107104 [Litchfieldia salsa]|uniref:Uncharacterized protein n=2 Tax=Litchfieldia salsa TaxID=930152 RepID=A0A1H0VPE4_9BACI|nr:hypothetical protein SAMN05216565_107104 [Litchfieldia salsa]
MIYMYLVGFGCSLGIATTFFISLKLYNRTGNKEMKLTKKSKRVIGA